MPCQNDMIRTQVKDYQSLKRFFIFVLYGQNRGSKLSVELLLRFFDELFDVIIDDPVLTLQKDCLNYKIRFNM